MHDLLFLNIGTQEILILLIFGFVGLAPLILAIFTIIDIFKRNFENKSTDKILLIILVLFLPLIGSIIYFLGLRNSYPLLDKRRTI